ncbi:hypothetical protein FJY63_10570, partial [Candidatus Sumerlaeota bacterium]|nr:hypothetical protein [Candidatus Sumerlaeota bacterium]
LLQAQASAVERLIADEKRKPTRDGPRTISEALTSLDRSVAVVEHYFDRVVLRNAQKAFLPSEQPFCLCVAPAFVRVSPQAPTDAKPASKVELSMAVGEAESFQAIVVPYWERLERVRVVVEDVFRYDSIDRFDPDQIRVWLVQSIAVSSPVGRDLLWPDPLTPARPFDLPSTASQSVLVDLRARKDQPPGLYKGRLTVEAANCASMTISLSVEVRPFALPGPSPLDPAFQPRNDFLQERLAALASGASALVWEPFLANYGLSLYTQTSADKSLTSDWRPWLGEHRPLPTEALAADPYSLAAPNCFAYRRAAWAAWSAQQDKRATRRRWSVNGWVSFDPPTRPQPIRTIAPLVRSRLSAEQSTSPQGVIRVNDIGDPEPTLRLIALRDGIEDYHYLATLERLIADVKSRKAASWWQRRKWNPLLRVEKRLIAGSDLSDLSDPSELSDRWKRSQETLSALLAQREAVARAIEEIQLCLDKAAQRAR